MNTKKPQSWRAKPGSFRKALPGSISLNFSESGGANCDDSCRFKGRGCYAETVEHAYQSAALSGKWKREQGFDTTCHQLADSIKRTRTTIPWVRFSALGSVPNRPLTMSEGLAFLRLLQAIPKNTPVHFPVETEEKRVRYQALCDLNGHSHIVVRLSVQQDENTRPNRAESIGIGNPTQPVRENLALAQGYARAKKSQGIDARICPAIASTAKRRPRKIKCGECTLCAQPGLLIVYPAHR